MTRPPVTAVLLDVGGTLWPDGWPWLPDDHQVRVGRMLQALPELDAEAVPALLRDLDASAAAITEQVEQDVRGYAGEPLRRRGIEPTAGRVAAVVDAVSCPPLRRSACSPAPPAGRPADTTGTCRPRQPQVTDPSTPWARHACPA
jgi:hypothetical protein